MPAWRVPLPCEPHLCPYRPVGLAVPLRRLQLIPWSPASRSQTNAFIETYNQHAKPFVWTKARVHQKRIKVRFAEQ